MNKKKVIGGVLLAVLVASGSYYYFMGTPRYSLYHTRKAIRNHDSATFNKYVDVERVATGILEESTKGMEEEASEENGFAQGLMNAFMPALKETLKESVNKSIEEISEGEENKLADAKIKEIKREGKSTKATIVNQENEELRISMVKTPERYWRVVGIDVEDFKKISPDSTNIEKVKENEKKQKEEEEKQKYEKLRGIVSLELKEKSFIPSDFMKGTYEDLIVLGLNFTNHSDRNIKGIQGQIRLLDIFGNEIMSPRLRYDQGVNAGETKEYNISTSYNQFIQEHKKIKDTALGDLKYEWFPTTILYEDGSKEEVVGESN